MGMKLKAWIWGPALALMAMAAQATGPASVRKQVEASLLVTGSIDIERDGSVGGFTLDHADQLPIGVRELADRSIPGWKFEPVVLQDEAVKARTRMSLRIVARQAEKDRYEITIQNASFNQAKPGQYAERDKLDPPKYPKDAVQSRVAAEVYLVVKIGRDGKVMDVVAEQVNLCTVDSERGMKRWREIFARAAIGAAREWTFFPPTWGDERDAPFWRVRVPVDFAFAQDQPRQYGQWQAYVPGPRLAAPWAHDDQGGSDALAAGGVYPLGMGPRLLTPLNPT